MQDGISRYTLGIDLGTNSVGWAIVCGERVVAMGSRVFAAGVSGTDLDIQKGKEEPRNAQRRQARQVRRQTERRARRLRQVYNLLARHGLMPAAQGAQERHEALMAVDARMRNRDTGPRLQSQAANTTRHPHTWLYRLRAKGLDERLEAEELGRALYHLAQRRGFKSGRKTTLGAAEKEEEGKVTAGIASLREAMAAAGSRTIGEYLSTLDPAEERIRGRWTAREMYACEFDLLCKSQQRFHPKLLTETLVEELRAAMFFQRPLKKVMPGRCELESNERRVPLAHPAAQRIRMVQAVNNLAIRPPLGLDEPLAPEQRETLIQALESDGDLTMAKARQLIGVKGKVRFNLEAGGEERLVGDRTAQHMRNAIGNRWDRLSSGEQEKLAMQLAKAPDDIDGLAAALSKDWGFSMDVARRAAEAKLEPGYAALSLKAIRKLLPHIEQGERFGAARAKVYRPTVLAGPVHELLPPLRRHKGVRDTDVFPALRNPAVERSLAELRKVVNCLIRKYGKPDRIHLEVARDLKNSKDRRAKINDRRLKNEKARARAFAAIAKEIGNPQPNRDEVERYLLWEECGGLCPYTGRAISLNNLFGSESQFEVEHIIPRSRSLDNSFNNKTLCHRDANHRKANKTPWEAFGHDPTEWEEILQRVRRFKSESARSKLRRFEDEDVRLEDFSERQMNDTRYASKLAGDYLGLLYGGRSDADGRKRVQVSAGGVTGFLRAGWDLNSILNDGETTDGGKKPKSRDDHRHHAVDALVVALTNETTIQKLARASQEAAEHGRRRVDLETPWPNFVDDVRQAVDAIVVSHRADRRVQAKIHDDTLYSKAYHRKQNGKSVEVRRVRKRLENMSVKEVKSIVDKAVREAVATKLEEIGDPKKFADDSNLPYLPNKNGKPTVIRSARIERVQSVQTLGKGARERFAALAANHHLEVYALLDEDGDETRWQGRLVSMYEAMARKRARLNGGGAEVIQRNHGKGTRFKFSLAPGETIELDEPDRTRRLYLVRSINQERETNGRRPSPRVEFCDLADAREVKHMKAAKRYFKPSVNSLGERDGRKVVVSPIGEVFPAHD